MKISIIAAVDNDWAIGKDNSLLWHLPADMKFFKEKTSGHCVLTGRKNYESIPSQYRPLPNRKNLVISRQDDYFAPGAHVFRHLLDAVWFASDEGETELFIIGGGEIYRQGLNIADTVYLTRVRSTFDADTFFPTLDTRYWDLSESTDRPSDEKNEFDMTFETYNINQDKIQNIIKESKQWKK